jgi:uncharacterized protein YbjT (DUF2867 family)
MNAKTALVLGASGLVGTELLKQLLNDKQFTSVKIFVRKLLPVDNEKLQQVVVDFNSWSDHKADISGDVVFCCIGTTIKKAGSQDAFSRVDKVLPLQFARIAKENGVPKFLIVSAVGANSGSGNFYLRTKGEVEEELKKIGFKEMAVFRPSMLLGKRTEFRFAELLGKIAMTALSFIFIWKLKRYKAVQASSVGASMIRYSKIAHGPFEVVESESLHS